MSDYICIDIGGTSIKHGIYQEKTRSFSACGETPTHAELGGPHILKTMGALAKQYLDSAFTESCPPGGICISTAGMVDCSTGSITYASSLIPDYTGTPIKETLESAFHLPCEVENDVNCAGLAEAFDGAARHTHSSLCLTIGTGIGGCLIINHQILHGFSGSGCEVGYMHLPGGTFQRLGASSVLVKKVQSACPEQVWDGRKIFEEAKKGNPVCTRAIDEMVDILGMGIANICYVVNPEVVVLGGGIMAQREYLGSRIRTAMDKYLIPSVASHTRLAFAENGNRAGMLGAYHHFKQIHSFSENQHQGTGYKPSAI